jgi:signal transduction histidine kinase
LRLAPTVEIQLMRIIQEALSNVRKHARAHAVRVHLRPNHANLRIDVIDDGQGFDPARLRAEGWPRFGLQTMRERAESIGGHFDVETFPGRGTRVAVTVPLPEPSPVEVLR